MEEKRITQIRGEPIQKGEQVRVDVKLTNAQEFMLTSLLSVKLLAKKLNMDYVATLKLLCSYLKDENIATEALTEVEKDLRKNGIENL